jgi:hypothetical protein
MKLLDRSYTPSSPHTHPTNQPLSQACNFALSSAERYQHPQTESWNTQIINHILRQLISESTPTSPSSSSSPPPPTPWKFSVNSTIIQHLARDNGEGGRRGMHSACGAYWNNEKDGMWSFKFEAKGELS